MKTNQIIASNDRELFGIRVRQQTKNEHLCLTDLMRAYEQARWVHGWNAKKQSDLFSSKDNINRIYYLLKKDNSISVEITVFIEMVENNTLVRVLKKLGQYSTSGRGPTKAVYCNPFVWMLFAMELNPMLYAEVIHWLKDGLIFDRVLAGDHYMPMNKAISTITDAPDYAKYATAINKNVFGYHQTGMRNLASREQLNKISEIEKFIINGIKMNMIKTDEQVLYAIENY